MNPYLDPIHPIRFDTILIDDLAPAVDGLVTKTTAEMDALERSATPSWDGVVAPLSRIDRSLGRAWTLIGHMVATCNSPELRAEWERLQPTLVQLGLRLQQSRAIYKALAAVDVDTLTPAQARVHKLALQSAELSGVGLKGAARERFGEIEQELARLSQKFGANVLDATAEFGIIVRDVARMAGLPDSVMRLASDAYTRVTQEPSTAEAGPWRIGLERPVLGPFMQHSQNRDLRKQLYRANVRLASEGDTDNRGIIDSMLALRQERARLLGYDNHAQVRFETKMARDVAQIDALLDQVADAAAPAVRGELEQLQQLAAADGVQDFQPWDRSYYRERTRQARFGFSDEDLRPYFPLNRALEGLFGLTKRLFGVDVVPAKLPVWHPDVLSFEVKEGGSTIAFFYLDPYSRPGEKRGGAWCAPLRSRFVDGDDAGLPTVALCCNQLPPSGDRPSLMSHSELHTLFHEFGHGLQAMLTRVDTSGVAGLEGIEWDAVEIASQFMENWLYLEEVVFPMSAHVDTGEPLPRELFDKLVEARNFNAPGRFESLINWSRVDLRLHEGYDTDKESHGALARRVRAMVSGFEPLEDDEALCGLRHLFVGAYDAGFYSYLFSDVMQADCFAAFEEAGLDNPRALAKVGQHYRDTLLALGGSEPPAQVFEKFRGREPSTDALLRQRGLSAR